MNQRKDTRDTLIIPALEELIEQANYKWATPEVRAFIKKYWGAKGTNRQQVHKAICEHCGIDGVSFNQMRYFVSSYMRDELKEDESENMPTRHSESCVYQAEEE